MTNAHCYSKNIGAPHSDGLSCLLSVCSFIVHERCVKTVVSSCSSVATNYVKVRKKHFQIILDVKEL